MRIVIVVFVVALFLFLIWVYRNPNNKSQKTLTEEQILKSLYPNYSKVNRTYDKVHTNGKSKHTSVR